MAWPPRHFLCSPEPSPERNGLLTKLDRMSCSVIDNRLVRGPLFSVCTAHNVGVLAYGTLLGGFLSEKWLGAPEPRDTERLNWSLRKYLRLIHAAGGWTAFQAVLQAVATVAKKHRVPLAAVATRWVLDIAVVSAVIVGTRLSASSEDYTPGKLAAFDFSLDADDRALISQAQSHSWGLRRRISTTPFLDSQWRPD
jgi:aryl-alcohol dehydrogenase-like predicted oxidoreductase